MPMIQSLDGTEPHYPELCDSWYIPTLGWFQRSMYIFHDYMECLGWERKANIWQEIHYGTMGSSSFRDGTKPLRNMYAKHKTSKTIDTFLVHWWRICWIPVADTRYHGGSSHVDASRLWHEPVGA